MLRVPSLAQVSRVTKDEAMRVMQEHQRRLASVGPSKSGQVKTTTVSAEPSRLSSKINIQRKPQVQESKPDVTPGKQTTAPQEVSKITEAPVVETSPEERLPVLSLSPQSEPVSSDSELQALEEKIII